VIGTLKRMLIVAFTVVAGTAAARADGGKYQITELKGLSKDASAHAMSPDGKYVVAGTGAQYNQFEILGKAIGPGQIVLWETSKGEKKWSADALYRKKNCSVRALAFDPTSKNVWAGLWDGEANLFDNSKDRLCVWNWAGDEIVERDDSCTFAGLSRDGKEMYSTYLYGVFVSSAENRKGLRSISAQSKSNLKSWAVDPHGKRAALYYPAGKDIKQQLHVFDLSTGKSVKVIDLKDGSAVLGMDFDDAGDQLAILDTDGVLRVWDTRKDSMADDVKLNVKLGREIPFRVTPDGKAVVSISKAEILTFWDIATGKKLFEVDTDKSGRPERIAFGPRGEIIAIACAGGTVLLLKQEGR